MSAVDDIVDGVAVAMEFVRPQGLDVEARHILPDGWTLKLKPDGYVFTGPLTDESAMWSIVRFLSYKPLIVLHKVRDDEGAREYELLSAMASGRGFRTTFLLID